MHIMMSLIALGLVFGYCYYYSEVCVHRDYYNQHYDQWLENIDDPLIRMIWITFLILSVIFFGVGCFMLLRLRRYFRDFYEQFGFRLWVANIFLTLPLTFRGIFDALKSNKSWNSFWESDEYTMATYNVLIMTFSTYLPMVLQISSLIFGFVRHK